MDFVINKKYKIIKEIGEGAFGKLYIGKNINTDEPVAVKLQTNDGAILLRNEARIYNFPNAPSPNSLIILYFLLIIIPILLYNNKIYIKISLLSIFKW